MRREELYTLIQTNQGAIAWCDRMGLLRQNVDCPSCRSPMRCGASSCGDGMAWRCSKTVDFRRHHAQASIRSLSIFAMSNLSIRKIVQLMYEWTRGTGCTESDEELNLAPKTAIFWYKHFRRVASWAHETFIRREIGGFASIVEIDECQIGRRKHHRGRMPTAIWVVGGIVRGSSPPHTFMEIVPSRSRRVLFHVIARNVARGSHIITDGWRGYAGVDQIGYRHDIVNHSANFISPIDPTIHTQNIENLWRCLRRFLNRKGSYTRKHIKEYLHEFVYRRNFPQTFDSFIDHVRLKLQDDDASLSAATVLLQLS
jgi:transposase-like protein